MCRLKVIAEYKAFVDQKLDETKSKALELYADTSRGFVYSMSKHETGTIYVHVEQASKKRVKVNIDDLSILDIDALKAFMPIRKFAYAAV